MSANTTIYNGKIWTHHGSNKWILTLTSIPSGFLEAAIPLFISFVGSMTWIIVKLLWYNISIFRTGRRTTSRHSKLYYLQQQTLLRNSAGDAGTVSDSWGLYRAWKSKSEPTGPRTWSLIIITVIFFLVWQSVAVLSAFIWQYREPSVVLLRGQHCGYNELLFPDYYNQSGKLPFVKFLLRETIFAETYVAQCYGNNSGPSCSIYPSQSIHFDDTNDVECPFQTPEMCISVNSKPYQLDSGPINSFTDLGINAAPKNRVTYQKVTTCSPVSSAAGNFAQIVFANKTDQADLWPPDTVFQQYFYGPIPENNQTYTFEYSQDAPDYGWPYDIFVQFTPGPAGQDFEQVWVPDPKFTNRTDADVTMFFITANHIVYDQPVIDPFFLTDTSFDLTVDGEISTYWTPAFYVNVMGCIDQHKLCNPNLDAKSGCTSFMAYNQLNSSISNIGYNPAQTATAQRIIANLLSTNTFNSVNGRRGAALLASQSVSGNLQTKALPVNQWQLEASNWYQVSLAKLQQGIVDFAAGPSDPDLIPFVQPPATPELSKQCYSQLVPISQPYTNFDFTAVVIVLGIGFGIWIICWLFEPVMIWMLQRANYAGAKQWVRGGPFQLQKLWYESNGVDDWPDEEGNFPITTTAIPVDLDGNIVVANGNTSAQARPSTLPVTNPSRANQGRIGAPASGQGTTSAPNQPPIPLQPVSRFQNQPAVNTTPAVLRPGSGSTAAAQNLPGMPSTGLSLNNQRPSNPPTAPVAGGPVSVAPLNRPMIPRRPVQQTAITTSAPVAIGTGLNTSTLSQPQIQPQNHPQSLPLSPHSSHQTAVSSTASTATSAPLQQSGSTTQAGPSFSAPASRVPTSRAGRGRGSNP